MGRTKLSVERDHAMEEAAQILIEKCSAFYDAAEGIARVLAELSSSTGRSIDDYRTFQVVLYDAEGDIVGRDYTNWENFGLRQSVDLEIGDLFGEPTKAKAYPAKE